MKLSKILSIILVVTNSFLFAQNIGVKTGTPQAVLDVNGSVAYREGTPLSIVNGTNNNVVVDSMSFYRIAAPTAVFTITGFTNGFDGRMLTLINATNYTMTLKHLSTLSTAGNRINTGGSDLTIAANGVVNLYYNTTLANWTVTSSQGSPPSLTSISIGNIGDSVITINNGILGKVPPRTFSDYYAWDLTGNAGTVDGTNFIGTTDNIPLSFRVNNQKAGRIDQILNNVFWGYQAGNVVTGSDNVAMGSTALSSMTTGNSNVAIGGQSGLSNTTGIRNVSLGYQSARNGTHSNSVMIGYQAGLQNASSNNVFVGSLAAPFTSTGSDNVALGYYTLFQNTTGKNNVAIGSLALSGTTTSWGNTAVGYLSSGSIQTGQANVSLGDSSLLNNVLGNNNTAIGYKSGEWTTGSNNITIGYNAAVPVTTASNQLALGSWLYGTGGFLGINTIAPQYKLDIDANTGGTGNPLRLQGLQAGATSDSIISSNGGILRRLSIAQIVGSGAWSTTGNASTVDGTNFIGTTDNIPFNVRVFNQKSGRIDHINGNAFWGYLSGNVNTGTYNTFIGNQAGTANTTGINNVALGYQSLGTNTTGQNNTAVGSEALVFASTGNSNTATGRYSMRKATTGSNNAAYGTYSLQENTTGINNTAIGYQALVSTTTANNNTGVGAQAILTNTTGAENVGMGFQSLYQNTSGSYNTSLGNYSMFKNTSGNNNVVVGPFALGENLTSWGNTAIGYKAAFYNTVNGIVAVGDSALFANTTGTGNTAVGYQALTANTTGTSNTAIGYVSMSANTTGITNTAVGQVSMVNNTTGSQNTALGQATLALNTTGTGNTALGQSSLFSNVSGLQNTAVGNSTLYNNTGSYNTAVGNAMWNNTTGNNNTSVGHLSMNNFQTGGNNVAMGYSALGGSGTPASNTASNNVGIGYQALSSVSSGGNNVALGYQAGQNVATGTNNTLLGYLANTSTTSLTNATAIGANASVGASNSLVLGGTGANVVNVGIGTTTPGAALEVKSSTALSTGIGVKFRSSTLDSVLTLGNDANFKFRNNSTYDFGTDVNNFITGYTLSSAGFRTFTPSYGRGFFGVEALLASGGTTAASNYYGFRGQLVEEPTHSTALNETYAGIFNFKKKGSGNYTFHQNLISNIILDGGSGTFTNAQAVVGQLTMGTGTANVTAANLFQANLGDWASGYSGTISNLRGLYINYLGHARVQNAYGIFMEDVTGATSSNYAIYTKAGKVRFGDVTAATDADVVTIDASGNLNKRAVSGLAGSSAWGLSGNSSTNPSTNFVGTTDAQDLAFRVNNTERMRLANSTGYVGVGTTAPAYKMHIEDAGGPDADYVARVYNTNNAGYLPTVVLQTARGTKASPTTVNSGTILGAYRFGGYDGTAFNDIYACELRGNATETWSTTAHGTSFSIATIPNTTTSPVDRMIVDQNGKVGIGTSAPAQQLEITAAMQMPTTTSSTTGVLYKNGNRYMHDYNGGTYLGHYAGNFTNTATGTFQIGIGDSALISLTTSPGSNVAVGNNALKSLTTRIYNTAIGTNALENANSFHNTVVGHNAARNLTTGGYSMAMGVGSLYTATTPNNNVAIGYRSLYYLRTGTENLALGFDAGNNGATTGQYALTTGNYNTFLGTYSGFAGDSITQYDNVTVVGYKAAASASNCVILGSTNGVNSAVVSTNVGMGVTAPAAKVHQDNGTATANYLKFTANVTTGQTAADGFDVGLDASANAVLNQKEALPMIFSTSNTEQMRILSGGNVGIGVAAPVNKLDVEGGAVVGATYSGTNTAPTNGLLVEGNVGIGVTSPINKLDVEGAAVIGATYSGTNTAPTNGLLVEGNVGVGTASPNAKMDVSGSFAAAITTTSAATLTLDATHYTVIINTGATTAITLPAASTCARRIYVIVNRSAATRTISAYSALTGFTSGQIPTLGSIMIQSDGTTWYQIK